MAFNTSAVNFEVRTAGNDSNGGGCVVKTRTSVLVSDVSGHVGMGSLIAGGFVAGDVGHSLTIFATPGSATGWIGGLYTITAVSGAGVATLNSSPGASLIFGSAELSFGLDYSQQNAAQYTFADLASTNGNAGSPVVTSASHVFVAVDVGNILQITAGVSWIAGFYQVISVAAGAATLDRAAASVANVTAGTYAVGGALITPQHALVGTIQSPNPFGNKGPIIYIKQGTYTFTAALDTGNGANQQQPNVSMVGYDVARGDQTGNKPLFTTSTFTGCLIKVFQNTQTQINVFAFDNINFSSTAVGPGPAITVWNISANTGGMVILRNCKVSGFGGVGAITDSAGVGGNTDFSVLLVNCEIGPNTGHGVSIGQNGGHIFETIGCFIHNNGGSGFTAANIQTHVNTIFDHNGGRGCQVSSSYSATFINCNFTNNGTDGLANTSAPMHFMHIQDCIFYGNTAQGLLTSSCWAWGYNNAFGSNGGGNGDIGFPMLLGSIFLTASPFVSSTNFALNNTAGGGAVLTGAGSPGPFGTATTATPNIGAIQGGAAASTPEKPRAYIQ